MGDETAQLCSMYTFTLCLPLREEGEPEFLVCAKPVAFKQMLCPLAVGQTSLTFGVDPCGHSI